MARARVRDGVIYNLYYNFRLIKRPCYPGGDKAINNTLVALIALAIALIS